MSITLKDQISGDPVVIENPLLPEHIEVGRLLWYSGMTSMFSWDCPAIITRVNKRRKVFRVRSLDDMVEQDDEYDFVNTSAYADSRGSMRLTTQEKVEEYLKGRRADMKEDLRLARRTLSSREKGLVRFDKIRATLFV